MDPVFSNRSSIARQAAATPSQSRRAPERNFGVAPMQLPAAAPLWGNNAVSVGAFQKEEKQNRDLLLETAGFRDRMADLRLKEQSRADGSAAMNELSRLDPTDPNYVSARNDIIQRNPNAALDKTVSSWLSLQDDEFRLAEADRAEEEQAKAARANLIRKQQEEAEERSYLARKGEAERRQSQFDKLSPRAQEKFDIMVQDGSVPEGRALQFARFYDEGQKKYSELLQAGIDPEAVAEVVDDDGFVDLEAADALLGAQKAASNQRSIDKDRTYVLRREIESIDEQLADYETPEEMKPELRARRAQMVAEQDTLIMPGQAPTSGGTAGKVPVKGAPINHRTGEVIQSANPRTARYTDHHP